VIAASPLVRPANVSDAECIASLIARVAGRFILPEFSQQGRERFLTDHRPEPIRQRMESGFEYHVAEAAGEIVGVVGVRDGSHLYHLFVAEEHQGRGLGRTLWEHAKAQCLRRGRPAAFTVNSSRGAVPVYERFGFKVAVPEQEIDGVRFVPMRLELPPQESYRE